jgi:glutathione synthase
MTINIGFQMDPLEGLSLEGDTTLAIIEECLLRNYNIWHFLPKDVSYINGEVVASSKMILELNRDIQPSFKTSDSISKNLKELDLIFLRQDPPFDMSYITSTFLLEYIEDEVKIINKPSEVRNAPEKLFLNRWRDLTPETLITKNISEINSFRRKHKNIILKPLYGNGGNSIFFLNKKDKNFNSLIEIFLDTHPEQFILQEYLPNIKFGDKRIILINGKPEGAINRIPSESDIRANLHVGGEAAKTVISNKEMEICESIGPELIQRGLLLVGIDIIGDKLTEINVTSPTGFREIQKFSNINLAKKLIESLT